MKCSQVSAYANGEIFKCVPQGISVFVYDIQTVTKVLMSSHSFNDPNVRQRLLAKGEPQLVEPGKRILLETASLQMEARIVDASYGGGSMPTNSYFDRLTLELAVWPKNG